MMVNEVDSPIVDGDDKNMSVGDIFSRLYYWVKPIANYKWMETSLVKGPNPNYRPQLGNITGNPEKALFMNATFINFNVTGSKFEIVKGVASELLNCYNKAKYRQIYTNQAFSGVLQDILYEPKYGYFKFCMIIASNLSQTEKSRLIENKQDLVYFQFHNIEHSSFRYKTIKTVQLMMGHFPKALRNYLSPSDINGLLSLPVLLDYYDNLIQDTVFYYHTHSYIYYQNFTSSLEVNGVYIELKQFSIKGIYFLKERFFIVQGDQITFTGGKDKTVKKIPYTLIRYLGSKDKERTDYHILTNLHNCILKNSKTNSSDPEFFNYMTNCFDTKRKYSKYINNYRLPNDLSIVLELNEKRESKGEAKQMLVALRWDERAHTFQVLVDTSLDNGLDNSKMEKTSQRFDSMQYFVHIVEETLPNKVQLSKGRLLEQENSGSVVSRWYKHRNRFLSM